MIQIIRKLILVTALTAVAVLSAGEQPTMYAVVDYMRVAQGTTQADYIALEKLWQRLHQKAADAGICRGWYFCRVENGGRNQFVTVRVYDSLEKMRAPWPENLVNGLYSDEEMETMQKTEVLRHLTRSELWQFEASAIKEGQPDDPPYIIVHFMKPARGKSGDYYPMERDLFRRIHQASVDKDHMRSWFFMSRQFPSGYDAEYDFVTMRIYADKASADKRWGRESIESALTAQEWEKAWTIGGMREIVREEIWHAIAKAEPSE